MVEDEAGPRLPEKGALVKGDEQIDLHAFYDEFIRPGRGIANVGAEIEADAAEGASTNYSAVSKKSRWPESRQVKRLRERPFFLASDGDWAVTYGVRAYA